MATSTTSNNAQLKIILVQRAMKFVHDEFEDPLNSVVAARRWRGTNIIGKHQLSARARDIVEAQWNPVGAPGSPDYEEHFQDLIALYKSALQNAIIPRLNSGNSPHTSDESPPSDGSDTSESDGETGQGQGGYAAPKITNMTAFHTQAYGEFCK